MTALDRVIAEPRRRELDHVELAASTDEVWESVRHRDLPQPPLTRLLFALRTIPDRLAGKPVDGVLLRLDEMQSSADRPGFQILTDGPHEVVVGAIGKVWRPEIVFTHVPDAAAFAAFSEPGWIKVAWALRVVPRDDLGSRLELELRVDATDDASWTKFKRYFLLIGPPSRFIRRSLLTALTDRIGTLAGDELIPDATKQSTRGITIAAPPEQIWPWLVQMGCGRAGFYSIDAFDNGGVPSAREIHPELQHIAVGQVLPATPNGPEGFEVLAVDPQRALVLGGLFDLDDNVQLPFSALRPKRFWHVSWAFVLDRLGPTTTRLRVRARAAVDRGTVHALWIRPVHHLMQTVQLRNLAARAEGRLRRDTWRDIVDGLRGAARMLLDFVTPRRPRIVWGIQPEALDPAYPGDHLVEQPRWGWTHAIEIDAPAESVWPWVAQIGADRAGFYSYQWLENLAGCNVRNAETIHREWQVMPGDDVVLHPRIPPLRVVDVDPGRYFVATIGPSSDEPTATKSWVTASWLFLVEPLGEERCRFISRYRIATSDDLRTRAELSEVWIEPIGFAMDRRMLLGVKERVERAASRWSEPGRGSA